MGDRAQGVWAIVLEEFDGDTDEVARFLKALLTRAGTGECPVDRETSERRPPHRRCPSP